MAQLITSVEAFPSSLRGAAVAVGNFDGVHLGHARLVSELVAMARRLGGPSLVWTFDPPPAALLFPDRPLSAPLTSIRRRAALLGRLGVDVLMAFPTDLALLNLSAEEFFQQKVIDAVGAAGMVEGPNFRFGRERLGDTGLLSQLCQRVGIELRIVEPAMNSGQAMISSTQLRALLSAGNVSEANQFLTQPYQIEGVVTAGSQRGREIGFPTANISGLNCLVPAHGVYCGLVAMQGKTFPAAINIGPNPTFEEARAKVEIHIIGWSGSLYGQQLACALIARIRDVLKFDSMESLKTQLQVDIQTCVRIVNGAI